MPGKNSRLQFVDTNCNTGEGARGIASEDNG